MSRPEWIYGEDGALAKPEKWGYAASAEGQQQSEQPGDEPHEQTEPQAGIITAYADGLRACALAANTPGHAPAVRIHILGPSRWDPFPIADITLDDGALQILTNRLAVLTRQANRARAERAQP